MRPPSAGAQTGLSPPANRPLTARGQPPETVLEPARERSHERPRVPAARADRGALARRAPPARRAEAAGAPRAPPRRGRPRRLDRSDRGRALGRAPAADGAGVAPERRLAAADAPRTGRARG